MPVLPPLEVKSPELEEEKTTKESMHHAFADQPPVERKVDPEQLNRYGTPIGLGLNSSGSGHVRTGTNGSMSGLSERMIELQVTDNADTQSMADDSEYQTPRPSMDAYSTRSSMQSVRGPFQHQYYQDRPTRRSSLMSNYSTLSSPRGLPGQGSKKEALLWGSVQVVGQFMVDGSFIRQHEFESLKSKTMYRPTGSAGGGAIGGGTLGTVTSSDWRDRASEYTLFSALVVMIGIVQRGLKGSTLTFCLTSICPNIDANRLFPVFSTPPSILFVDLNLAPGESCSCKF